MAARVGLTGGIGSGKSTVLALFRDLGVPIISADDVARKLSTRGSPEFEKILEEFSDTVLGPDGEINRGKLGSIVFDDEEKRARLEAILHPGIRKEMLRFADKSSAPYCILEIPLLIETGQYREMDRVLVVTCKVETRRRRLKSGRGLSPERFDRIIAAQLDDGQRSRHAHDTLANDGELTELSAPVSKLHTNYEKLFGN